MSRINRDRWGSTNKAPGLLGHIKWVVKHLSQRVYRSFVSIQARSQYYSPVHLVDHVWILIQISWIYWSAQTISYYFWWETVHIVEEFHLELDTSHLFHTRNIAISIHSLYLLKWFISCSASLYEGRLQNNACCQMHGSAWPYRNHHVNTWICCQMSFLSHWLWCCNSTKLLKLGRGCTKQLRMGVASSPAMTQVSTFSIHMKKQLILKRKENKTKSKPYKKHQKTTMMP